MSAQAVSPETVPIADAVMLSSIEQFLYYEAELLDGWKLDEWLTLMHPDVRYRVPAAGAENADPNLALQVIHDDHQLLSGRVTRLKSKHAHAESPKSHTRRMVTNVRAGYLGNGDILARSNFHVLRNRLGKLDNFVGSYRHILVPTSASDNPAAAPFLIRDRLTVLDHDLIEAGGTVSIVL
jgi:p-cumate 2,3-dioxygenase beta subunit